MNNVAHELGLDDGEPLDMDQMQQETVAPVPEETLLPSMPQAAEEAAPEPVQEPAPEPEPIETDASQEQADIELVEKQESPAQKRIRQEIDRRKELQGQLDQQREQIALMEQRFQTLMERANSSAQPEPEPEVPDFDDDPAAHLLAQQQRLQDQVAQQNAFLQRQQAEQQRQAQITQMVNTYTPMEEKFASEHEDYYPRVEALKSQRLQMYQAMGKSEAEANQMVMNEAMSLVHQSLAAGRNPAEIIYQYATTAAPQPVAPAPQAPPAAQQSAPMPSRLGTRGSTPRASSMADLASMSDEEFDRATQGENWRRLMGG